MDEILRVTYPAMDMYQYFSVAATSKKAFDSVFIKNNARLVNCSLRCFTLGGFFFGGGKTCVTRKMLS